MKLNSIKTLSDTVKGLAGPALEGTPLGQGAPAPVQITGDADYEVLPPGTTFIAPDGSQRVKP